MTTVSGRYFAVRAARFTPAAARLEGRRFIVEDEAGALLAEAPLGKVRITARLGNVLRRFRLPDGAQFETPDNDGVDAMLAGTRKGFSLVNKLERSWPWVMASLVAALVAVGFGIHDGIPALARELAADTPPELLEPMTRTTLKALDGRYTFPTTLDAKTRARVQADFDQVAARGANGRKRYKLLFRFSPLLGPNAFSLPDGTIVVTDAIVPLMKTDDEVRGVLAHEIAHADRQHQLQRVYQTALVPAVLALLSGDPSMITQVATFLPGIIVQSAYSREFEQQADDDSARTVVALGGDPASLAHLLKRLRDRECGKKACESGWLGSHPETDARVMRLLQQSRASGHKGK